MPRGKATDPEIVEAAKRALLANEAVCDVARNLNLPRRTVTRIAENLGDNLAQVGAGEGGDAIGEKLAELILANAEGMIGIAKIAKDPAYLKTQQAGGLAQLYAALADTTLQLLEAAENASAEEEDQPEE